MVSGRAGRWLVGSGILALLPFLVGSCVQGGGGYVTADAPAPAAIRTVLLLPINFDRVPPPELAHGVELTERAVKGYLTGTGREVLTVRLSEVMSVWRDAAAEHGLSDSETGRISPDDVEAARVAVVRRLAVRHPADAVAVPAVVIREGWHTGMSLRWDGVSRRVPVHVAGDSTMEVHSIGGKGMGTSLQVTLYASDGVRFFERFAGLEPVDRYEMSGYGTGVGSIRSFRRTDLFRDPEIIQNAVRTSFYPAIPPPDVAAR